jgi:hypothetical protein
MKYAVSAKEDHIHIRLSLLSGKKHSRLLFVQNYGDLHAVYHPSFD